jgi:hypothetical protein
MEPNQAWNSLRLLDGDWRGFGTGGFPTIDSFKYREHLRVRIVEGHETLLYLQSTWRIDGDEEHGSHIETGFISVEEGGQILVLSSQGSDRVEVLRGGLDAANDGFTLNLRSTDVFNDERMVSSWRELRFTEDSLNYSMGMATDRVSTEELHLTAELHRATE